MVGVISLVEKKSRKVFMRGRMERLVNSRSSRIAMPIKTCLFEYGCGVKGGRWSNGKRGRSSKRKERKR